MPISLGYAVKTRAHSLWQFPWQSTATLACGYLKLLYPVLNAAETAGILIQMILASIAAVPYNTLKAVQFSFFQPILFTACPGGF